MTFLASERPPSLGATTWKRTFEKPLAGLAPAFVASKRRCTLTHAVVLDGALSVCILGYVSPAFLPAIALYHRNIQGINRDNSIIICIGAPLR